MIVQLHLDAGPTRRWHLRTVERIAALAGTSVRVSRTGRGPATSLPDTLFRLEKLIYGVGEGSPTDRVDAPALPAAHDPAGAPDVVIDVTGRWSGPDDVPVLHLCCNGAPPDVGAVDAVLAGVVPVLTLDLAVDGTRRRLASWRVAVEDPHVAVRGVGPVLGRAVQLLVQTAADLAAGAGAGDLSAYVSDADLPDPSAPRSPAAFAVATLRQRVGARIRQHLRLAPRWSTGVRRVPGAGGELPQLAGATFDRLPDDGRRFYADPFLWRRDGRDFLFVEEFPYATERGVVSVAEIGADGRASRPRIVLEADCHLSYPFLLEHDGVVHLVPESSRRRAVELWRAVSFPDRWELASVLVDDVDVVDATIVRRPDGWYLLASPREEWTSSWDALAIWTAPHLEGPWRPVAGNPVVVDVESARSAGTPFVAGGRLVRPVQDCAGRYGAGLGFAVVDRLDAGGFAQTVVGRLRPARPLAGLHTYNRSAGLETVDVFGPSRGARFRVRAEEGVASLS